MSIKFLARGLHSMQASATTSPVREEEALMQAIHHTTIQSWLTTRLAEQFGLAPEDIDVRKPFTEYGLDSIVGVFLAGDLEEWLGLKLSPTVLWDYPTTETLAHYLAAELWRQGADAADVQSAS